MKISLSKSLTKRDIFGAPITLLYKKDEAYKTRLGAFFTILTFLMILFNLFSLFTDFISGSNQKEKS